MEELYGRLPTSGTGADLESTQHRVTAVGDSHTERHAAAEGFEAAYCGHPRWSDGELDALARQAGFARSLVQAFRERGQGLLQALRGPFAIAIAHRHEPRGLLAIDRMGVHSLSYTQIPGRTLHFGTHLAHIFASGEVSDEIDPQALFNYIYFHVVPSPRTIYRAIRKLEPAQCIVWKGGDVQASTYWRPAFTTGKPESGKAALLQQTRTSIENAVRRCADGEHTGAFLSGGLDSSTVAGMLRRVRGAAVPTYSIGFNEDGYDELPFARIAARHFDTAAREHYVTVEDIEQAVPLIATHFDEPFGNSSAIPTYICARFARDNGTTTLLAGDGGDELFAGNSRYAKQALFELYSRLPAGLRARCLEPALLSDRRIHRLWFIHKMRRYVEQAITPLPDRLESHNLLNTAPLDSIFHRDFLNCVDTAEPLRELGRRYQAAPTPSALDQMLFLDWKFTLADNDLRKVNGACTIAGVDVRYPMLDEEVVELSARIPPRDKLERMKLRAFYKEAFRNFLPHEIITKRKHGFGLPFGQWLKVSPRLRERVDDTLADLHKRGLFAATFIDQVRASHQDEHAAYFGTMLWVLFMLEQWWQIRASTATAPLRSRSGEPGRAAEVSTP